MKLVFIFISIFCQSYCWDNEELEMFDVVEEVNQNFYDFIGVSSTASSADIRKAYRRSSLELHPDRNKAEDAEVKFRQLTAVYEILKDAERRKQYDHVLEFGLPDWRQPVFYYRKVKKLGLLETSLILFLIFTIGHFLVIWAAYFEKRFEMEEVFNSRKKKERKSKRNKATVVNEQDEQELLDEILQTVNRPSLRDLLPLKCARGLFGLCTGVVFLIKEIQAQRRAEALKKDEEEENDEAEDVKPRRKRVDLHLEKAPERSKVEAPVVYTPFHQSDDTDDNQKQSIGSANRAWTSEDDHLLAKAVAKFPGGTTQRWDKIAAMLDRPVSLVISKAKNIKTDFKRNVEASAQGITGVIASSKSGHLDNVQISTRSEDLLPETVAKRRMKSNKKDIEKTQQKTDHNLATNLNGAISNSSSETNSVRSSNDILKEKRIKSAQSIDIQKNSQLGVSSKSKLDVKVSEGASSAEIWSQNQQKIFEWSLTQYPKGTPERWDKIASEIPGKTKENCIARFKYLASIVQQKKKQSQE